MYLIYEQKLLLGILFPLLMQRSSKLLLPATFLSFPCCLSLCLLLSVFLVAISLFPVPRVPQSSSAEGDTISRVELANELTAAKNSRSSHGALREWYLSLPVVASFFLFLLLFFKQHCGCLKAVKPQVWNKMLLFPFTEIIFSGCQVLLPKSLDFSVHIHWTEFVSKQLLNSAYFSKEVTQIRPNGHTTQFRHKKTLMAARFIGYKWDVRNLKWPLCRHLFLKVIFNS